MRDFTAEPITASSVIHAPIERVFALSTRVELVKETLGMNLVDSGVEGGVFTGHIAAHSRVVWRGWKFGLPTSHHTLITGFDEPHREPTGELTAWFQDSQERGRFAFFQHDHHFRQAYAADFANPLTELHDEVRFALPFGPLGALAAQLVLAPHILALCKRRFARLKSLAEGEGWREWVSEKETSA
jgi:ligand-binding SRPBCC domain-containing protein